MISRDQVRTVDLLCMMLYSDESHIYAAALRYLSEISSGREFYPFSDGQPQIELATKVGLADRIFELLQDEDTWIHAAILLDYFNDGRLVASLLGALRSTRTDLRFIATGILGRRKVAEAVSLLIELLNDEDEGVKATAAWALGNIGDKRAVEPIIALIGNMDNENSGYATALGLLGDARAFEPLLALLDSKNADLKETVIKQLGKVDPERAISVLQSIRHNWSEPWHVRYAAVQILDNINQPMLEP